MCYKIWLYELISETYLFGERIMLQEIKPISLSMPFGLGNVNCYLLKTDSGNFLIDTGYSNRRAYLVNRLINEGCNRSNFKLIILTHGDFDHVGNAAYLRREFSAKITMHRDDVGMVKRGDMLSNRRANRLIKLFSKVVFLIPPLRLNKSNRFMPDLFIEDGFSFLDYDLDAKVLNIPGHSRGSIGILTAGGDLFCGDLLINSKKPSLNSIIDNLEAANSSIERLNLLKINMVYPGHGNPFLFSSFATKKK
jgi:hydroxyacylglutathione hydrolase